MCFHWKSLQRQVRISGNITKVSDKEADIYFDSRPYESKIGAWISNQSSVMQDRQDLLRKIADFKKKYKDEKKLPRPTNWSGWRLNPSSIEFWLGDDHRIHERLRYNKISHIWKKEILYP